MHIIQIEPVETLVDTKVYNDHYKSGISEPPDGWAMIPDDMVLPSTFPRLGSIEVEPITYPYEVEVEVTNEETGEVEIVTEQRERVIMTVTAMTEGTLPEIVEVEPEPTAEEMLNAMLGVTSYE